MNFRFLSGQLALVLLMGVNTTSIYAKDNGFSSIKIYPEFGDCTFNAYHETYSACPNPGEGVNIPLSGRNPQLLTPIVQAGIQTFGVLLTRLGQEDNYVVTTGISIDPDKAPKCLLVVQARFSDAYRTDGQPLSDHLVKGKGENGTNASFRKKLCVAKSGSKTVELGCAFAQNSDSCPETINKETDLNQHSLLEGIRTIGDPNFIAEFRLSSLTKANLVSVTPVYLEYVRSIKNGGSSVRDLVLLAATGLPGDPTSFSVDDTGKITSQKSYVAFSWPKTSSGSSARFGDSEPDGTWMSYGAEADDTEALVSYNLWLSLIETRRGNIFFEELGKVLSDVETQKALTAAVVEKVNGPTPESKAEKEVAALEEAASLAEKRNDLVEASTPACEATSITPKHLLAIEPAYSSYSAQFTKTALAMKKAKKKIGSFPEPGTASPTEPWIKRNICPLL